MEPKIEPRGMIAGFSRFRKKPRIGPSAGEGVAKMKHKKLEVKHVWVIEVAYRYSRWLTLWTTCRLTKLAAQQAFRQYHSATEYKFKRATKFLRAGGTEGKEK